MSELLIVYQTQVPPTLGLTSIIIIGSNPMTSFRLQANDSVERFNKTLINMLSMYCQNDQTQWDEYLQQVIRLTVCLSTLAQERHDGPRKKSCIASASFNW